MPATPEQRDRVLRFYDAVSKWLTPAVRSIADDPPKVLGDAREHFAGMLDEIPYVDRPQHTMAPSMFACASMLAVYRVVREHGIDAHAWGRATHALPAAPPQEKDAAARDRERDEARASEAAAAPNEFVFEIIDGDVDNDRGMNIKSCAICHLFGRYDAMDLVPYMCSFDDVVSTAGDQGLRRTGTIALGAKQCDFRFRDGEPLPLADQYPDRIRLRDD